MTPSQTTKIIILAAGRGSRLKDLTKSKPKCLLEIQGKSILQRQLESQIKAGISENNISIVTGYCSKKLDRFAVKKFQNNSWSTSNMVYSLLHAREWLENYNCIISYSDIFYTASAIKLLTQSTHEFAITYDPNWQELWGKRFDNPLTDAESFELNSDSTIKSIGKNPHNFSQIEGQYMGLIKLTPHKWKSVAKFISSLDSETIAKLSFTDLFQTLIESKNELIGAVPYFDTWGEVDNENDLQLYNNLDLFPLL